MHTLQVITLDHAKYERELNNIPKSHSKSIQARDNMKLRPVMSELPKSDLKARLPKLYRALEEDAGVLLFALVAVRPAVTQSFCLQPMHSFFEHNFPAASAVAVSFLAHRCYFA